MVRWHGATQADAGTSKGFWNPTTEDFGKVRDLLEQPGPFSILQDQTVVKYRKVVQAVTEPCS